MKNKKTKTEMFKVPTTGVYNPSLFYKLEALKPGDSFIVDLNSRRDVHNYNRGLKYKIKTRKVSTDLLVVLRQG